MSVESHEDGVTIVRDDHKSPLPSVEPALDFLRTARARRKIVVIGTISDYTGSSRARYVRVAQAAAEAADLVVFAGPRASSALRARRKTTTPIMAFSTVRDAFGYLDGLLQAGDLVLLKGSKTADHLVRISLARTREVGCWRQRCGKKASCERCDLLTVPAAPEGSRARIGTSAAAGPVLAGAQTTGSRLGAGVPVVVGLGNPGPQHQGTPHNVGHAAVDLLAKMLDAEWVREGDAWVARAEREGQPLCLVRLIAPMNASGPALEALSARLGFVPTRCVLVYDDVDLPLGKVRLRMSGSSGGHRGLESIIQELQSTDLRRVKIGVGRLDGSKVKAAFLLAPFAPAQRPAVAKACEQAAHMVLDLVTPGGSPRPSTSGPSAQNPASGAVRAH